MAHDYKLPHNESSFRGSDGRWYDHHECADERCPEYPGTDVPVPDKRPLGGNNER